MGLKLKACADCGQRKMIGRSKRRCKSCRRIDPTKQLPPPVTKKVCRKKQRLSVGPFENWLVKYLPKCVHPQNSMFSSMGLSKTQRNFVLQAYGYSNYKEYLQSELWASIREKILKKNDLCVCGCNRIANQVHHKVYSESNLLGKCLRGLVAINHDCHHDIEFDEGRKVNLGEANQRLKERKQQ